MVVTLTVQGEIMLQRKRLFANTGANRGLADRELGSRIHELLGHKHFVALPVAP